MQEPVVAAPVKEAEAQPVAETSEVPAPVSALVPPTLEPLALVPEALEPQVDGAPAAVEATSTAPVVEVEQPIIVSEDSSQEQPPHEAPEEEDQGVPMTLDSSMAEAGRTILADYLHKLEKAEPVAREGSDPEGVHDMRVATRRLRASLELLEETVYDSQETKRYRKQLRGLAQALGNTRDADVFLQNLEEYRSKLSEEDQAGIEPLYHEIKQRQTRSRKAMLKTLDNRKTRKLLKKLKTFVETPESGVVKQPRDPHEVVPFLVKHFVASTVWRRYEEVLAYEAVVSQDTSVAVLHRLRVAAKHMRYTVEYFQDALPATVKTLHKQLVDIQDHLGDLHDDQVAIELCEHLLKANPEDAPLRTYQSIRAAHLEQVRQKFLPEWHSLTNGTYKTRLATALKG